MGKPNKLNLVKIYNLKASANLSATSYEADGKLQKLVDLDRKPNESKVE